MAIERDIDALPGERWFPKESTIEEDMKALWGDWGVCSESGYPEGCAHAQAGKGN